MGFGSLEPGNQSITAKRNGNTGIQYTHEISGCPKLGSLKMHHSGCFFEYERSDEGGASAWIGRPVTRKASLAHK